MVLAAAVAAAVLLLPALTNSRAGLAAAAAADSESPPPSSGGSQLPTLEELGSSWVPFATGATVPTRAGPEAIPIDCPSISNTAGSIGSCEPGCPE